MKQFKAFWAMGGLLGLVNSPTLRAAEAPPTVADLVAKMPADSIAAGQEIAAQIVQLGPDGIRETINLLVPPGAGDDAKVRFTLNGLAFYVTRPGAEAERAMFSGVLIEALGTAPGPQVKTFLVNLLQLVGQEEAVAPLGQLLADPELGEPATQALIRIGTPGVVPALRGALPTAEGKNRVTLIRALGELRAQDAVPAILPFASSEDADLRRTALYALANIGDPAAREVLAQAAQAEAPYERAHATALYLTFARRLAEAGRQDLCVRICRDLLRTRTAPRENNVVCDALAILVGAVGEKALGDLLAAVDSPNKPVRAAALQLTHSLPGEGVTARLVAKMKLAAPEVRAEMVDALGRRGDRAALPAVLAALKEGEKPVRLAAIDAAARFLKAGLVQKPPAHRIALRRTPEPVRATDVLSALLAVLETDQAEEVKAVQDALLRTPGDEVLAAAAAVLPEVPAPSRVALLQVLAGRRARAHLEVVFTATRDENEGVRVAAFQALGVLASGDSLPRIVDLLFQAPEGAEQEAARQALVRVCQRNPDAEARAEPVLAALGQTPGAQRTLLLEVLRQLGGGKALQAVLADTQSPDPDVQDAAVRALAEWPEASAAPELLNLARNAPREKHQVMALRGYVRLVGLPSDRPAGETVRMYQEALATARRPDEKRLVLAGLSAVRTVESLRVVATCLDDEALRAEAAAAAVQIALPQKEQEEPLQGREVVEILKKVREVAPDEALRQQVADHLDSLPPPDEANLARGQPVTTSVAQQGNQAPGLAVDGNAADRNSAWFGAAWPSWLKVDLGKPARIDTLQVFFYWDGNRYYQYTVDVSPDDQTWKTVVDASQNTQPATSRGVLHRFDPVEARYVRINILKNSANEAVHLVELKVYAAGTAPAEALAPRPDAEGFIPLFNGKDLTGWVGSTQGYVVENGVLVCLPEGGGLLRTEEQYGDFAFRFEFRLTPNANNGVGIRFTEGNPAYSGMEIQILDDSGDQYQNLQPYQYHGSIYGVVPCERGHQKPVGEWNSEEIIADGRRVTVLLNGVKIVDADLDKASTPETMDHQPHPGLKNAKGYIGFLGHGSRVEFRNIRIKELRPGGGR